MADHDVITMSSGSGLAAMSSPPRFPSRFALRKDDSNTIVGSARAESFSDTIDTAAIGIKEGLDSILRHLTKSRARRCG